jgi:hypothetical protein
MLVKVTSFAALLAVSICLCGCSGGGGTPDDLPDLYPVTVTVTQQGQPIGEATVVFAPASGNWGASGITDAAGTCQLRTLAEYDGVAQGQYRVSIKKMKQADIPELQGLQDEALDAKLAELKAKGVDTSPQLLTPAKYATPGDSGLEADVPAGGTTFTFDLEAE